MLSIVKVLGSILSDVMLIPGKAKNILKVGSMTTEDCFGDFKDIVSIEIHCMSLEGMKKTETRRMAKIQMKKGFVSCH